MHSPFNRPNAIALAVAAACASLSFAAHAAAVTVTGQYALGSSNSGSAVTADNTPQFDDDGDGNLNVDYYLWKDSGFSPAGNSVFFHTYGYESGGDATFGARASGEGVFYATTKSSYSTTVDISGPQAVKFDFNVSWSELAFYSALLGNTGTAQLQLIISLDGTTYTKEDVKLTLGADGSISCVDSGFGILGSYMGCGDLSGTGINKDSRDFSVNLGVKTSDFTLQYDIIATVSGDMSNAGTECAGYGEFVQEGGYGGVIAWNEQPQLAAALADDGYGGAPCNPGQAIARSGDPLNIGFDTVNTGFQPLLDPSQSTSPFAITTTPANTVPEPSTLLLAGAALGALAARRRKPG
ncbi:PEP-CTERM sorting domain-containing protein [Methyloversatilis thermotolerans]|uniref:PEP-CTERM sorting domain-containing protein n=1 Tax=Methyloversatilis thermotolerans TaxID=1346290 RepID=UPI000376D039|nr:PEP-CTERM sorting domain-containing protein [Methyloversatilis thermotolerans]